MWEYKDTASDYLRALTLVRTIKCHFCGTRLVRSNTNLPHDSEHPQDGTRLVRGCNICGWWTAAAETFDRTEYGVTVTRYANVGVLRSLDSTSYSAAIEETKRYLERQPEARFTLSPKRFEEVVASVYRDLGYHVRITGQRGDGGIDVILDGPQDTQIGVQVKQWRGRIQAEEIRSLCGALFLHGMPKGIFVTTSNFTKGAASTAALSALRGLPVELLNWQAFFDAMKVGRIKTYGQLFEPDHISAKVDLFQIQQASWPPHLDQRESLLSDPYLEFCTRYEEDKAFRDEVNARYPE